MKKAILFMTFALFATQALFAQIGVNIFDYHFTTIPQTDPRDDSLYKEDGAYYLLKSLIYDNQLVDNSRLSCTECSHYIVKFLNEEFVENSKKATFDNPKENLISFESRIIHPDGSTDFYNKDSIHVEVSTNDKGKEDTSYVVNFNLHVGDILEYYDVSISSALISGHATASYSIACKKVCYTLLYPGHLKLDYKTYNTQSTVVDTVLPYHGTENGDGTDVSTRYIVWELNDNPPFRDEPNSLRRYYAPRIEFTIAYNLAQSRNRITSISQFSHDAYNAFASLSKEEQKAAKAIAKEIVITKDMTTEQKIRAVENHLKTNYHAYNINHSFFSNISTVKAMHLGNDVAFLKLYNYIFNMLKIDHNIVFTTDKNSKAFDKKFEGKNFMSEALIYFPTLKKYIYSLDDYRLGLTNPRFTGNEGAFMEEISMGKATTFIPTFKTIQPLPYTENFDSIRVNLTVHPDSKEIKGSVEHTIQGYRACGIQTNMSEYETEDEENLIEYALGFGNENVNVSGEKYYHNKPEDIAVNPLRMKARFSTSDWAAFSSKQIDMTIGGFIGKQSELDWKQPRLLPIDISYGHYGAYTIVLEIPQGYSLHDNYKNLDRAIYDTDNEASAQAGFVVKTEVKDGKLLINCYEFYKKLHYEVSEYENIKKIWNASYEFNKAKITLVKD